MNATVKWVLIGVGVAFAVGLLLGLVEGASGIDFGLLTPMLAAFAGVFTGYIGLNLSGNKRVAVATDAQKQAALALKPAEGQAPLVVFREGFVASMAGMNLSLDGREVAQLKSPQFTVLPLDPGAHRLEAAFGGLAGPQNSPSELTVKAASGQVVAIRAAVRMGMARNTISLEPDAGDASALRQRLSGLTMVEPSA